MIPIVALPRYSSYWGLAHVIEKRRFPCRVQDGSYGTTSEILVMRSDWAGEFVHADVSNAPAMPAADDTVVEFFARTCRKARMQLKGSLTWN